MVCTAAKTPTPEAVKDAVKNTAAEVRSGDMKPSDTKREKDSKDKEAKEKDKRSTTPAKGRSDAPPTVRLCSAPVLAQFPL